MKAEDRVFIKVKPKSKFVLVKVEVPAKSIGGILLPHHHKFDDVMRRVLIIAVGPDISGEYGVKAGDRGYVNFQKGAPLELQYRNRVSEGDPEEYLLVHEFEILATFDYVTEADKATDDSVVIGLAPDKIKYMQTEKANKMDEDGKKVNGRRQNIIDPGSLRMPN